MEECFHCHRSEIEKPVDEYCSCGERVCVSCKQECIERESRLGEFEEWEVCDNCNGDGFVGHDCGEDTCCCLHPEENLKCSWCDGVGGWKPPEASRGEGGK